MADDLPHPALADLDRALAALQTAFARVVRDGNLQDVGILCEKVERMGGAIGAMMDGIEARLSREPTWRPSVRQPTTSYLGRRDPFKRP